MPTITIVAEIEVRIDVAEKEIAGWNGRDDTCPAEIRERMEEALHAVVTEKEIYLGDETDEAKVGDDPDGWVQIYAEVMDIQEVRAE